ncbi:MAG: hypothetical protein ABR512_05300 [Desulfopila sp.]
MTEENSEKQSQLIEALRQGVGLVQMVLFKELRDLFAKKYPQRDATNRAMLIGAVINRVFGMENPEEKFQKYNKDNQAVIEQEMLGLKEHFPQLAKNITDALRVQVLCDSQEGQDSTKVLQQAETYGFLLKGRETPLPSTFMTVVRLLGEKHGLTVAPQQVHSEDDTLLQ